MLHQGEPCCWSSCHCHDQPTLLPCTRLDVLPNNLLPLCAQDILEKGIAVLDDCEALLKRVDHVASCLACFLQREERKLVVRLSLSDRGSLGAELEHVERAQLDKLKSLSVLRQATNGRYIMHRLVRHAAQGRLSADQQGRPEEAELVLQAVAAGVVKCSMR